ncbi:uncharacterized protein PV07_10023 [Cladophialophora immunda]|uniref:Zn(2)-C6 fungal-type domain-containing protein n=1 Tax=Cladophialophora immunda TaxID=569365 RepID=A0A0D1Z9E5_9EURO|nr:uncharacterized protein PV07_10023 [Cladophialophora immunda]KIW24296.1 hypothetical protein PV07_10023 [Cladophialophora immunda]OQU97834.1 Fungal specific transcription factor domain-containing protein [Cladophialophora immunda]
MARKSYKKSRDGCKECKRRHVKCDETRPRCIKCTFSDRQCVYSIPALSRSSSALSSFTHDASSTDQSPTSVALSQPRPAASPEGNTSVLSPVAVQAATSCLASDVNMLHLELFYHYERETCLTVCWNSAHIDIYRRTIIRLAFQRSFLMEAILALSSLHLSLKRPQSCEFYRATATALQSSALEGFRSIFPHDVDRSNVLDVLLFQHVIALHVFCDTFSIIDDDYTQFMDRLISCIRLLRGIDSVTQDWWDFLWQSEIGIIMQTSHIHQHNTEYQSRGECNRLRELISFADMSPTSIAICTESLSRLQSFLDAENALGEAVKESTNMIFSWLISAQPEFVDLLESRRPEALALLASYAVILHRRRGSWVIGDSGRKLLKHINAYLGNRWQEWLSWPTSVISSDEMSPEMLSK